MFKNINNLFNFSVKYPQIVKNACVESPLLMRTFAGRRIAIADLINSNLESEDVHKIAKYADSRNVSIITTHWLTKVDKNNEVEKYLEQHRHQLENNLPTDFDLAKQIETEQLSKADVYYQHICSIGRKLKEATELNENLKGVRDKILAEVDQPRIIPPHYMPPRRSLYDPDDLSQE